MHVNLHENLGQLVVKNPGFVPILEEYRLDFCCQGQQTLIQACESKGVDSEEVLARLSRIEDDRTTRDWGSASLVELIEYIQEKYHKPLQAGLPSLREKANRVARVHGTIHPELNKVRDLVETLSADLLQHTLKEDTVLFPWIHSLERGEELSGSVQAPIRMMEAEHEEAGALLDELRFATHDYDLPEEACTTYRLLFSGLEQLERDTHLHIHLENSVLFPRALALTGV